MQARTIALALLLFGSLAVAAFAEDEAPAEPQGWRPAVEALRTADSVDDAAVGAGGVKSATYEAYELVRDHAPRETLVELLNDGSLVARCYAVRALIERREDIDVGGLLLEQLDEPGEVRTFRGCIMSRELYVDVALREADELLHENQRGEILGRLLHDERELQWRRRALWHQPLDRKWRPALIELLEAGNDDALVALAHQHDEAAANALLIAAALRREDVPFAAFEAARINGQSALLEPLLALREDRLALLAKKGPSSVRTYLAALARHPGDDVRTTLLAFLAHEVPGYYRARLNQTVAEVATENLGPDCDAVLWTLFEGHAHASPTALTRLTDLDAERARRASESALLEHLNDTPVDAVGPMLDVVRVTDPAAATKLAAQCIADADVHHMRGVADWAGTWQDDSLVEPLFARYENDTNPHVYLAAARALVRYETPEIDARLRKSGEREGWGGEKLRPLLDGDGPSED